MNMQKSKGQARRIVDEFKPDLVVGTGGYASFPVVKEAARRKIPTAVHESNAVPGLTTKALSKVVDCVMVGFEESRAHYDHPERVVVTGTPVRGDFFRYTRQEAREKLGLADDRPLLLSYWGSLGAEVMNRRMVDFLEQEAKEGAPFRHIHGAGRDFNWMQEELLRRGVKLEGTGIEVREYIYDMPLVMAAADVGGVPGGGLHHLGAHCHRQAVHPGALSQRHRQPPGEERPGAVRAGGGGAAAGEGLPRHGAL